MVGGGGSKIQRIDKAAIHRICSGQVVLDLAAAVKELVENSLDAGATNIEIRLKEYGAVLIEVADNGSGISPDNYQGLTLKYHTSKISEFSDLQSLSSFGFRGEALSSLCALSNVSVTTRTKEEAIGTRLDYDHSGAITSQQSVARAVGTTVAVAKLFAPLPVRHKEFTRNIRREYGRLLSILQAYALIAKGVRIVCTNQVGKSGRSTVIQTQGSGSVKDNVITVFGIKTAACLEPLELSAMDVGGQSVKVEGFVSKPGAGCGRASGDRQFFYVNGRPVDLPKISRLLNELYRSFNSSQCPMAVLNIMLPTQSYDVNVTPDKRKVFLHMEADFIVSLRTALESVYAPDKYKYALNNVNPGGLNKKMSAAALDHGLVLCQKLQESPSSNLELRLSGKSLSPDIEDVTQDQEESLELVRANREDEKSEHDGFQAESEIMVVNKLRFETPPPVMMKIQPSTPQQEGKQAFPSFPSLDRHSFQCKGAGSVVVSPATTGANLKARSLGHVEVLCKTSNRNMQKVVQSQLTGFMSQRRGPCKEERCVLASMLFNLKDLSVELEVMEPDNAEMVATVEPLHNLAQLSQVEKPTVIEEDKDGCCGDDDGDGEGDPSLAPVKPTLVIGMDEAQEMDIEEKGGGGDTAVKAIVRSEYDDDDEDTRPSAPIRDIEKEAAVTELLGTGSQMPFSLRCFSCNVLNLVGFSVHRGFAAATLDADGMDNIGADKEAALMAATRELERSFNKADFKRMKVLGQFNLGFILARLDQDLFIIDQHASDEKFNFERLSKTMVLNRQPLLRPMPMELSAAEELIVTTHLQTFRQNGFDFIENDEAPPGRRLCLSAVPFSKNITFGIGDVQELVSLLADEPAPMMTEIANDGPIRDRRETAAPSLGRNWSFNSVRPSRVRGMLASRACRSSIMIGDALSQKQMEQVLCHLAELDAPWNCPHGRPTMRHLADLSSLCSQ
ncbi:unnamed protein product [Sphagnum troendelagicum]|uniref:DNA mismatch repair protein PMS1 n=1 Tax=Sphagnum troendelagicum TaxID=128251 RepID=A0ABP0TN97_9BRYO